MELVFTDREEAFRQEVREFLKRELPSDWEGFDEGDEYEGEGWEFTRSLARKLAEKRWLTLSWPKEYGGQDLPIMEQVVYLEEMAYHMVPSATLDMGVGGIGWVGPTLMLYGTEEQKREHIPLIGSGERFWCTGYSEPDSGSDLASLQTQAVSKGDYYLVNGQKIWNSGGHVMDWCWLAVRTDPDAPKHKGISLLLVDMKSPGITVKPITNMAGAHHFNQLFFEDLKVPKANLVGEENRGWYYVAVALDFERSHIRDAAIQQRRLDELIQLLKGGGLATSPSSPRDASVRHRLAETAIEIEVGRWMAYRVAWMQGQGLVPNSEASICKILITESSQRLARTVLWVLGLYGQLAGNSKGAVSKGKFERDYLLSVAATIAGGTSEIQRTIIARRGLGLPRQ
ncbi:MAG: acyl-CoA dehydrogenase family protein [Chloroflexi bacterium]|nr:acyl-CoA dehydrogenase family protein [Chloroflexota bacterium]